MSIPFLLGPVETGSAFMLASIQNGQPFVLNGFPTGEGIIYYWESNIQTILGGTNLGIFSVEGSLDALTLTDTVNGGGIGFTGGVILTNVNQPMEFSMSQQSYANWWPPDIFLSMAIYTITDNSGATASILTSPSPTGGVTGATNVIILPVLLYSNCTSGGSSNVINQPLSSVTNWFCNVNMGITGCSGTDVVQSGWTNLSDCTVGYNYTYCPTGDNCGNSNCKGPCPTVYDDCNYKSGDFVCQFDPLKYFTETQWWTTPIFIGSVVAIIAIILVLILVILVVSRRDKLAAKPPTGYESYYISG
ncbi:Hypothetical protein HVR_LOCUS1180 [uncultured virus]|nr:Hypothetical protein HVR_LOCUS1180 [uncultured virus]